MGKKGKQRNTSNSSDGGGLGASAAPSPFVFSASPDAGGPSSHSQGQTPAWAVRFQKQSPEVLKIAQRMEAGLDLGSPDVPHLPGERLPPVDKWDPIHAFSALDIALSPDRMERFRDSWDFGPMAPSSWAPYWAMRGALDWMSYRYISPHTHIYIYIYIYPQIGSEPLPCLLPAIPWHLFAIKAQN